MREQSTRADYTPAARKGKHLNFTERQQIERWLREGVSVRKIAVRLNRNHSTIVRERGRGLVIHVDTELKEHEVYSCERAQGDAGISKTAHGADLKLGINTELARQMAELLTGGGEEGFKYAPYAAKKVSERLAYTSTDINKREAVGHLGQEELRCQPCWVAKRHAKA